MSFKVSLLAAAAAATFIVGPVHAQVVNGDFNGPSGGMATIFVDGWMVGGNVDVKPTAGWAADPAWAALMASKPGSSVAGDQFLDLTGNHPGMIVQQLATVAGESYRLSFDFAANVWSTPATATFVASLYWGTGGIARTLTGGSTWSSEGIDFTPGGQTTLSFMSLTPLDMPDSPEKRSGALLDNIAVTGPGAFAVQPSGPNGIVGFSSLNGLNGQLDPVAAVPEPETYAMMLLGLAAVGFVARRRVRAQ